MFANTTNFCADVSYLDPACHSLCLRMSGLRQDVKWLVMGLVYNNIYNLDWGPVPHFAPWKHCSQCGLLYIPVAFLNVPALAARCLPRPHPAVAKGGTMGEKWVCTQGSFTCHTSATWDR